MQDNFMEETSEAQEQSGDSCLRACSLLKSQLKDCFLPPAAPWPSEQHSQLLSWTVALSWIVCFLKVGPDLAHLSISRTCT